MKKRIKIDLLAEMNAEACTHTVSEMAALLDRNRCYRHVTGDDVRSAVAALYREERRGRRINPGAFMRRLWDAVKPVCWFCEEAAHSYFMSSYRDDPEGIVTCSKCTHRVFVRHGAWRVMVRRRAGVEWMDWGLSGRGGALEEWFKTYAVLRQLTDITGAAGGTLNMGIRVNGAGVSPVN